MKSLQNVLEAIRKLTERKEKGEMWAGTVGKVGKMGAGKKQSYRQVSLIKQGCCPGT